MTASNNLRAIILGSGSSGGVPRFGGPDGAGDTGRLSHDVPVVVRKFSVLEADMTDEHGGRDEIIVALPCGCKRDRSCPI